MTKHGLFGLLEPGGLAPLQPGDEGRGKREEKRRRGEGKETEGERKVKKRQKEEGRGLAGENLSTADFSGKKWYIFRNPL